MRLRTSILSAVALVTLGTAASANADDAVPAPPAGTESTAVVRPATVSVDVKTGAESVIVPSGCSPIKQPSGQLVVLCPFAAPKLETPPTVIPSRPAPPKKTKTEWYGWQVLLVDGASLATALAIGIGSEGRSTDAALGVGLTGYALGGPIVHWSNGQLGQGFGSLSLRVGAPLSMAFWSWLAFAAFTGDADAAARGAAVGAAVGVAASLIVDVAVLAKKQVPLETTQANPRARRATGKPKIQWTPTAGFDARRSMGTVGIAGTF